MNRQGWSTRPRVRVSVIIPVLREAHIINSTLAHVVNAAAGVRCEIVVVDGERAATTVAAIARPDVLRVLAPTGRALQMNAGAARSRGAILLFLHADTRLPAGALAAAAQAIARGAAAGAFRLGIDSPRPLFRLIEAAVAWRTRLTRIPYGDQAIFLERGFFRRIGGYRPLPVMEDVDLMRRVKRSGGRVRLLPQRLWTSARRWEREGLVGCTLRNWMLLSLYLAGVPPRRLAGFYPPAGEHSAKGHIQQHHDGEADHGPAGG
jgi:rSAM/selenodomain-associated transferase 2